VLQSYLRRRLNVRDRHGIKTPHHKGQADSKHVDLVENSIPLESQPHSSPSDAPDDVTHVPESQEVDTEKVLLCDMEFGDNSSSNHVNDINELSSTSEMSHALEVNVEIKSYSTNSVQSTMITSYNKEPENKLLECSIDSVQIAAVESDDAKAISNSSSCPVSEASVVACYVAAGPKSFKDLMGKVLAAGMKSVDTEAGTKMSDCSVNELSVDTAMNGAPAATGSSHGVETDSKSCSDTVSDLSSSSLGSRDQEAGSMANSSEVSSIPASVVNSNDTETGTKSTPTSQPSPGRYLRKSVNYTGSPLTKRKSVPRTSTAYVGRTSSADSIGSQKLSEVSLSSSTDTGLSVASTSQDQGLSRKPSDNFSVSAELQSPSRHVRHSSEPHIVVTQQALDAVSMDVRPAVEQATEPSSDGKTASPSLSVSKYTIGTVSAPATPLRVKTSHFILS